MKKLLSRLYLASLVVPLHAAVPPEPADVRPAWVNDSTAVLTWTADPAATSYNVYRYDTATGLWNAVGLGLTSPHFRETPSAPVFPLDYAVTGVNADGEGPAALTAVYGGMTAMFIMVTAPDEWAGTLTATNAILSWAVSPVSGADGMLELATTPGEYSIVYTETNYLGYHNVPLGGLTPATIYYYRITTVATDRLGTSYESWFATPYGNRPPQAISSQVSTLEDSPVELDLTAVDPDGDPVAYAIDSVWPGTLIGTPPLVTYIPPDDYHGPATLTYTASDGFPDGTAWASVAIDVAPVNDPPLANDQTVTAAYNTPVNLTLDGTDVDGDTLSFVVLSNPEGTLSGSPPALTFTPGLNWSGVTSFTFQVNDGALPSVPATVTITVDGPTGPPGAPGNLTATAVSKSQINLAWADNASSEDGFEIERSTNGSSWTQIAVVDPNTESFADTGLSKKKGYYYRVRAYNALGHSAYSNTAFAKTFSK